MQICGVRKNSGFWGEAPEKCGEGYRGQKQAWR